VVLISERPAEAEDRAVPGHWEGDLLVGRRPSAVVTLVERASRYLTLVALPEGYKAEQVRPALAAAVTGLPEQLRRSLTGDQGKEMAEPTKFTVDTGVPVSFCDPQPW
jgi:transposase, IS30 family